MKILSREFLSTTTPSVHAATMAFFKDHPVYAWFGGSREGAPDVAIYLNNLNGDNKTIIIGGNDSIPRWNPILMSIGDKLFLFIKAGLFCDRWQTFVYDITNWTSNITNREIAASANMLPAGLNGPTKTKPIIVDDNIYCGSSVETIYDWSSYEEVYRYHNKSFSFIGRSNPLFLKNKQTYQDFNGVTRSSLGVIQPSIWVDQNHNRHCFMRASRNLGRIYYSKYSWLSGELSFVWDNPRPTNLPNPNSGIDTVYMDDRLYLVYNPSETNRNPLVISQINQVGETSEFGIEDTLIIKDEVVEKNPFISPELSYPYMVGQDGKLHLVYTYGRIKIEHVIIEL